MNKNLFTVGVAQASSGLLNRTGAAQVRQPGGLTIRGQARGLLHYLTVPFRGALLALCSVLMVVSLAGCESARTTQSAVAPRGEVVSLPPRERPTSENQMLATAAAQPPAQVEGEGWRPLFDGK